LKRERLSHMKKKLIYAIIGIGLIAVSVFFIVKKQHERQLFEQAYQEFEKNVLADYLEEIRSVGFEDLEITVEYTKDQWEEWAKQAEIKYYSEEIDDFYTQKYGCWSAKKVERLLKEMRTIRDRYCKRYVYEIQGQKITILFQAKSSLDFTVYSEEHYYRHFCCDGYNSMSIDGNQVYKCGSISSSSDSSSDKKVPYEKFQYTAPSSPNNNGNLYDDYDVYDYDDPEDFYYDWEEDFDGYEDAEDYWYDAWDEIE